MYSCSGESSWQLSSFDLASVKCTKYASFVMLIAIGFATFFSSCCELCSHPWETTVEAAYRKYPNPHSSNVHTLDTVQRRVTSTGGLLSHRIFGTRWNIPTIALNVCLHTSTDAILQPILFPNRL